jgi:cell division protein ZapA
MVDLHIAGRTYQVACREGEEETLQSAARLVDAKSREALAGLGTMSEARQLLFASLLLADQLVDQHGPGIAGPDPKVAESGNALASRLEALADALESEGQSA